MPRKLALTLGSSSPPSSTNLASPGPIGGTTPAAGTFTRILSTPFTLTDGATVTIDASLGNCAQITLAGDRTWAVPTNPSDSQVIRIRAFSTAVRTNTWNAVFKAGRSPIPLYTTGGSAYDFWTIEYVLADTSWYFQ